MKTSISILALLLTFSFVGCAGKGGGKGLKDSSEAFQRSIRWNSIQAASNLMDPRYKTELIDFYGNWVQKNKTVEATIVGSTMHPSKDKADVWVEFQFFEIIHETLKTTRQKQTWAKNPDTRKWMITAVE